MAMRTEKTTEKSTDALSIGFVQRVLFVLLAGAAAFLAFKLLNLWLLVFGAVLFATVLRGLAEPLIRYTPLKPQLAVVIVVIALLSLFATTFYLFGRELADQTQTLTREIPQAWAALQLKLQSSEIGRAIQEQIATAGKQASGALASLPVIAGNIVSTLADVFIALIGGIILAMNPGRYRDGVVVLFPDKHHDRITEGMNAAGHALRLWFIAQFISMVLVGILVGLGLSIVGLKSAIALGLLAGLAQFLPFVGPTISAGTGMLLAGVGGVQPLIWTFLVYFCVSQTEANFLTPFVQRRIAAVPVVLTLFAVIGFAGLLGPVGVLYAMPMTVMLFTLTRRYLEGRGELKKSAASD